MNKRLENIFHKIIDFFELVEGVDKTGIKQVKLYGKEYTIKKWNDLKYKENVKTVIRFFPKNSSSLIESYFSSALLGILLAKNKKESIIKECAEFVNNVNRNTKLRSTCIPIEGVDIRVDCIDFGFGKLYKNDAGVLPTIIDDRKALHSYQHGINALESCMCYFEINEETDHVKSLKMAKSLTLYVVNLLSFYIGSTQFRTDPSVDNWHSRLKETEFFRKRKIAIYDSESNNPQIYYEFYKNTDAYKDSDYSLDFSLLTSGHDTSQWLSGCMDLIEPNSAKATYHLVDENIKKIILSSENASLLSCVLQKNEIEKRIFQSINWFGKAINSNVYEEQFLFIAISIESLLVGDEPAGPFSNQGGITQKISERSAFLLGNDVENRIQIEKDVKKLYGLRSKIVHTGARVENKDVIQIETMAKKLILIFSEKKYTSHDNFLKWLKHAQYI
ncbi:hypothetical protein H5159_02105 [Pseudoalteromonas sp. SG43-1]|uniref:HEPN domain-containing protein n=1 Tax=Pseudoalteromonas sp. SG43-1 TaxID=2760971 RepID=UPI0016043DEE|nr:HEPN domain-containing protein [Pseudoalteromonas sp. SG43-1]MBB1449881.1 hypothetical protein [Pseudoalteromonas sp. SG43-1]